MTIRKLLVAAGTHKVVRHSPGRTTRHNALDRSSALSAQCLRCLWPAFWEGRPYDLQISEAEHHLQRSELWRHHWVERKSSGQIGITETKCSGMKDIGPAIQSAFNNCVTKNKGSTLYIPAGNYNMATWVTLNGASQWALQLDGVISRTCRSYLP